MLVRELILELERVVAEHPQMGLAEVTTEGCDCDGDVETVEVRSNDVYLRRGPRE